MKRKKIIIICTIVLIILLSILVIKLISSPKLDKQEQVNNEQQILDDDDKLSKEELESIEKNFPDLFSPGEGAKEYLQNLTKFTSYQIKDTKKDYTIIETSDSNANIRTYVIYNNGIYFEYAEDINLENPGIVKNPNIAIMVVLTTINRKLDNDYNYYITQLDNDYEVEIVSKTLLKSGQDGLITSYRVNQNGEYAPGSIN